MDWGKRQRNKLDVELSFQVCKPGFLGMFENSETLMVTMLTSSSTMLSAMVLRGKLTVIPEKKS